MKVAITGGYGFLGWHTACQLRAVHGIEPVRLGRQDLAEPARLTAAIKEVDAVLHLAGVNRAESNECVERGNVELAALLGDAIGAAGRPLDVVYANSVQAKVDNPYGRGKAAAADLLASAVVARGGHFADLLLPNLFGEHGRPDYNSFVATFAHEVLAGRRPTVTGDREIELLHAQDAASALIAAIGSDVRRVVAGEPTLISGVLAAFEQMHKAYCVRGEIPDISTPLMLNLFNTFRAAAFPDMWPITPQVHSDSRGDLFEAVRVHGGTGMAYASTTRPGQKRGEHYHLRKVERFVVVQGQAEINLRRLLHDEVRTFRISGDQPAIVDMPTMWVHNIRNVGQTELVTMFWSDQLLDQSNPDQFPETIAVGVSA